MQKLRNRGVATLLSTPGFVRIREIITILMREDKLMQKAKTTSNVMPMRGTF